MHLAHRDVIFNKNINKKNTIKKIADKEKEFLTKVTNNIYKIITN